MGGSINAYADKSIGDINMLSRGDCIIFVMMATGVRCYTYPNDEQSYILDEKDWYSESYINNINPDDDFYFMFSTPMTDILHYAVHYAKIINGEDRFGDNNEYVYINIDRNITLNECLALMVRCLESDKAIGKTLDETRKIAESYKLIVPEDEFYNMSDEELSFKDFKTIFVRFLNTKAGWVHHPNWVFGKDEYNTISDKTYRDHLRDYYEEEYITSLIEYNGLTKWSNDIMFKCALY